MAMMRQGGPNNRRPRGRHQNNNGGDRGGERNGNTGGGNPNMGGGNRPRSASSLRHQTFDSNGPDVRVRGNAWQVHEKYQSLARDATSAGDRVMAETYMQHAEHYYRIIEAIEEATAAEQRVRGPAPGFTDQQPAVPTNYYGTDGTPTGDQPQPQPTDAAQPQPTIQAEVVSKTPPAPSSFFTQEEVNEANEGNNGPDLLVANR